MDITVNELNNRLSQGDNILLIDVREPFEHKNFNIGGVNIPINSLFSRLDTIKEYKNSAVVVYCRSGSRSSMGKRILIQSGFSNVKNLIGGILEWEKNVKK